MSGAAASHVAVLPYDSELLGSVVASTSIEALRASDVLERMNLAKELGATLTYLFGDPLGPEAQAELDRAGARVVDERMTYVRKVDQELAGKSVPGVAMHDGRWPDEDLCELAIASGEFSRFRVDPQMPMYVFDRLYRAWIAKSVSPATSDVVFVSSGVDEGSDASEPRRLLGMVAVGRSDARSDIRLLAVSPRARGRGVGSSLVRAANIWAAQQGLEVEQVVTQHANIAARALYERCGYALETRRTIRHLWRTT